MQKRQNHYWKLKELSRILKTQPLPVCREVDLELELTGISTDTRELVAGELFVALSGANFNGQDFVEAAIAKGAVAVVVSGAAADLLTLAQRYPQVLFLPVADTLTALGDLARARLAKINPIVIAVTGSNGKTTTKEMLAQILAPVYRIHKTAGNFNNCIGLPLTVFAMPDDCQVAVLEMGMNAPGEIAALTAIARPDYAIITNVAQAHLQGLGSLAAIARAKCEVIAGLKPGATVIYNSDNQYLARLVPETVAACPADVRPELLPVSEYGASETKIKAVEIWHKDEGQSFVFLRGSARAKVTLPCWGRHNVMNAVLALAAGTCLAGVFPVPAANSLTFFKMPAGRLERYELANGGIVLHDAYNANPDSMAAALTAVAERRGQKFLALILGDMNELGPESVTLHRQVGEKVAEMRPDLLLSVGDLAGEITDSARSCGLPAERVAQFPAAAYEVALNFLKARLPEKVLVLVKGSRSLALEKIVTPLVTGYEAQK
jgi:UDP-N-acetylmuramoyl-tripeptide--D-alanyl-D-alanine ligase